MAHIFFHRLPTVNMAPPIGQACKNSTYGTDRPRDRERGGGERGERQLPHTVVTVSWLSEALLMCHVISTDSNGRRPYFVCSDSFGSGEREANLTRHAVTSPTTCPNIAVTLSW